MVAEVATNAESLWSRVRSTVYVALFSGTFTAAPPLDGVRETPTTVTLNERRFVVPGGVSGVAVSVISSVAVPLTGQFTVQTVLTPLQEARKKPEVKSATVKHLFSVIEDPAVKLSLRPSALRRLGTHYEFSAYSNMEMRKGQRTFQVLNADNQAGHAGTDKLAR